MSGAVSSIELWRDSRGRLSVLRILTLALMLWPIALAVYAWQTEIRFSARPVNDLIHRAGFWMLMFLLSSLAITPLRRIARYGGLIDVRRMLGVGAFCYGAAHLSLYALDQMFDLGKVASEIVLRIYLTVGFTALLGLAVLAATSTDGMTRALGGLRWRRLHQLVYPITVLALIHFFQQTKLDVTMPTLVTGLFIWLVGYRLIAWRWKGPQEIPTWLLLALSIAAAALTFAGEAIGIAIAFHVSPLLVLQTAFDIDLDNLDMVRPGWYVLLVGLVIVLIDLVCARWRGRRRRKPAPAAATITASVREPV
ncbi:MAG TPA: protein-methionine-sulfoxide reductase heme-binding subunit MsrQ [Xanthobacteraceae bacterium]|nr:protein-methionine-sulfoxide reductase heme-binding subunit MsrQ [Xanthobacteraceae bacterium]